MATISLTNPLVQSTHLYLQGAGSDGSDGTAQGVHLRWDFNEELAERHIPKGHLAESGTYQSTAGFNKANDFVKLYRTSYNRNFPVIIDFASMVPSQIIDGACTWIYTDLMPVPALPGNTCTVLMRFSDAAKYHEARQQYDPAADRLNFLRVYDGENNIIEVEVEGRFMFSAYVQMQAIDSGLENITRLESISRANNSESDSEALFISSRKKYRSSDSFLLKEDLDFLLQENGGYLELETSVSSERKVMAENIKYIRFRGENCFPTMLLLETYDDFLLGKNQLSDWQPMAELALSVTTGEVFQRLETVNTFQIDDSWPKYVDGAKVNVNNYKTRWGSGNAEDDLLHGVTEYLRLSADAGNLRAETSPGDLTPQREFLDEFKISYLDLLKLVAFDYHIARMLGFGYIDADIPNAASKYMYIAVYDIENALPDVPVPVGTHTCMTLPVGKTDYKLPVTPDLYELQYGLRMGGGMETPVLLTDDRGYSKYDDSRAVSLLVEPFNSTLGMGEFFVPDEEYSYVDNTEPILFGIAYRDSGGAWQKPEINHDPEFTDHENKFESVAVIRPNNAENNIIYTHIETHEGVHDYAVYGINWFSRVSPLSAALSTDCTDFPVRNTLVPPLNLGAQLIQKEDPLIFTTQAEQDRLEALPAGDKTLLRLTFQWNDIHASNYWYGKEAEFFFRTEALNFVKGKIKSVENLGQGTYRIRTESYTVSSINPAQVITPTVPNGKESRFEKSFLTTNEDQTQFEVQDVNQSDVLGEGAIFTVKASEIRAVKVGDSNVMEAVSAVSAPPAVGSIFSVAENASVITTDSPQNWPVSLTQKVTLAKLSEHTEPYTDSEGTTIDIHIGGVFEKAAITEFLDIDEQGNEIPNSRTGMYRITFKTYVLAPHSEYPKVEWYKGSVRIQVDLGGGKSEMRVLDVWNIETGANGAPTPTLQLIVYDGTFDVAVANNYAPNQGYTPIPTGNNVDVNYHPGYRAYFTHEAGFNQSALLPAAGAGSKQTLIACHSTDIAKGTKITSPLSSPAIILAREIIDPLPPEKPEGALFATRPNFFGKASYTFDTGVQTNGRTPYALVFYRANEQIILDALYKHETVLQIQEDLARIENDTAFNTRWNELVNVVTDSVTKQFNELNGYRFPNPDNDEFRVPSQNPAPNSPPVFSASINPGSSTQYKNTVKLAINNAFLSLTEQPVLYQYLKQGYQTSDKKPVLRDADGGLITPGSPGYDGSPMAVKLPSRNVVRFTDYTLDGASTSIFFYYAVEMNNMLAMSDRSEIMGPINLINTAPPKAPEIRKFYTRPENTVTGDTTAVVFEINEYPEGEKINKILIYRALNSVDAATVRSMQLAATIDSGGFDEPIIDDFSDLDFYPFGEVLYYRLVAVRTVQTAVDNGIYETEDVPSYPSPLILANIIDVNNPPAPVLTYNADENGDVLENVVLQWNPTAYNAMYYVYQMNDSGNWTELYSVHNTYSSMQYELPDSLPKTDDDGNTVFYRFKVMVENSSGLFNLEENIITI